jgi:hypothetical protein
MVFVIRVYRVRSIAARVDISDGRSVRVPKDLAQWGLGLDEADIVEVPIASGGGFWHIGLLRKNNSSAKELFRDFCDFDAEAEITLIRTCVLKNYRKVFGRFWGSDQLEDFTLEVFLHLWERDCFRRWDSAIGSYGAYINQAVKNCLIDIAKNVHVQQFRSSLSLDTPVGDSGEGWIDLLEDSSGYDIVEQLQANALYQEMKAKVIELDSIGTGVAGLTYHAIFDALVTNSFKVLKSACKCEKRLLDFYVSRLRSELRFVREACAV